MKVRELIAVLQGLDPEGECEVDCTYSHEGEPVRTFAISSAEEIGHQGEEPAVTLFLDEVSSVPSDEDEDDDG